MGTRLSVVTVVGAVLLAAPAAAQTPAPASAPPGSPAQLAEQAEQLYRAGDFGGALPLYEQAHQAEPASFDYQWGLAQTLRQTSQCDKALLHYQALREAAPDPATARDVRDQMALCPGGAIEEEAPPPPPPPPSRDLSSNSGGATSRTTQLMAVGTGAAFGISVMCWLDSRSSNSAADAAARFDDHERFSARADRMLITSGVAAVAGVGLAVLTVRRANRERRSDVAIVPRAGGGAVVWSGSW